MTLGERIKEQRNKLGFSQEKIAELVGTSRQAVTKWESNQSIPCMENLITLAEIFGISITELTNGENSDGLKEATNITAEFKGKVGIWWIFVILFVNLLLAYVFFISTETWAYIMILAIFMPFNAFSAIITMVNYVVLSDNRLLIHFGLSKTYVECKDIISIKKTNSPLAGSALSFDRLLITTVKGKLIIAIKNKEDFINLLVKCNDRIGLIN